MDENPYQSPESESLQRAPSRLADKLPFGAATLVLLSFTLLLILVGGALKMVVSLTVLFAIAWAWQRLAGARL